MNVLEEGADDRDLAEAGNGEALAHAQDELVGGIAVHDLVGGGGEEGRQSRCQDVDDNAGNGLVGPEIDAQQCVEHGIETAADESRQHGAVDDGLGAVTQNGHQKDGTQGAHEGAEALEAFHGQVGDTALFRVNGAHGHHEQGGRKGQAINKDFLHYCSPSFSAFSRAFCSSRSRATRRWATHWK